MDLLTGAMGILGPKLFNLLQHEYNLQTGLSSEVRSLTLEMEHIAAFLRKVSDVPWNQLDEQVKLWAREVREASYDMEDALDSFLVHLDCREPEDRNILMRFLRRIGDLFVKVKPRRDVAVVIEGIKMQVEEIAERRARYKIDDSLSRPVAPASAIDPRLAALYHQVDQLVGIGEPMDKVISMLSQCYQRGDGLRDGNKMMIVSIVGAGGLGKTTLAKAVYEKLKGDFDCGAFVPVGQNPDMKRVFKDILLDLDKGHFTRNLTVWDERNLIDEIRQFLKEKRYFIVIDDIWDKQSWEVIKMVLVEDNSVSRIITTTRNSEVAKVTGEVYKLQPLSYCHSRKLFYTRIFGGEGKDPGVQSDEVSDKILKKCEGIPLAVIAMASLLVGKPREVWSEIYSDIGFGQHKDNICVENTMRILSFSYYDLPSHLRTCLLYLSAFPEDYVIKKDPLIWKWIAEGFVYKKQGNGLFELGEQYFNDLINRSMIQAVESEFDGALEGCRVHDMVLDLIRSLSCHENSVTILDSNVQGILAKNKVRRLVACQKFDSEHLTPQADRMDLSLVRSYIASMCGINQWVSLLSFKLLRVLAIECCEYKEDCHIENLGNLLHLRYMSLKFTNVFELPKQIGNIKFLQTLDIGGTKTKELPSSIVWLTQLVCLSCDVERAPDGIGKLTSLEQLTIEFIEGPEEEGEGYGSNMEMFVKNLGSLRELRVLDIYLFFMDESVRRYLLESLRNLHKIQQIKLATFDYYYDVDADIDMWEATTFVLPQHLRHLSLKRFKFSRLPPWIDPSHLRNLSYLALSVVTVDEQDLKLLGCLTELRYLDLKDMVATVTVSKINASDGFFHKLRWFKLRYVMVQFQHEEDSTFSFHMWNGIDPMPFGSTRRNSCCVPSAVMPNLEVLEISVFVRALKDENGDCSNIGLEYLTSLQNVKAFIQCQDASVTEVETTEGRLQDAISAHRNSPTIETHRWSEDEMASSVQDQESEEDNRIPPEKNKRTKTWRMTRIKTWRRRIER